MQRFVVGLLTCLTVVLGIGRRPARAGDTFTTVGDVSAVVVPAGAVAYALHRGDTDGAIQGAVNWGATFGTTQALKEIFPRKRPDWDPGDDRDSFPSGHTSSAWAGAAFLRARYGIRDSWPVSGLAYGLAIATAVSRVEAKRHHVEDVIASAVLSEVFATVLVGRFEDNAPIPILTVSDEGIGVLFQFRF